VCAGVAAHLYVKGISHALTLRVQTDLDQRAIVLAAQKKISQRKATNILERDKVRQNRWAMEFFGVNEDSLASYDLVVRLRQITIGKVIEIIKDTTKHSGLQAMTYSQKCLQNLMLESKARTVLLSKYPEIRVKADNDRVIVHVKCSKRHKQQTTDDIKTIVKNNLTVSLVEVHTVSTMRTLEEEQEQQPFLNDD
jgi:hypothetical protein